jgi:hypothetical protein
MLEVFIHYKWYLLLVAEILAWTSTFSMFVARYWWESRLGFWVSFVLSLVTGIGIQLSIALIHVFKGGTIGIFEIVVVLLILYGCTYGKKHVKILDQKVLQWVRKKRAMEF